MASLTTYGAVLMVVAVAAIMGAVIVEGDNRATQARDYCTTEHDTSDILWVVTDDHAHELHCQLENQTLVDVPDRVFA